jgi:hypothetical protein
MRISMHRPARRRWGVTAVAAFALAGVLFATAAPAVAQEPDALAGTPEIRPNAPTGYYIWRDADGINLRTHGPRGHNHFVAVLHTDGVFRDVELVAGEPRDTVRVTNGGHTLIMDVHTYDGRDGVNFRVSGGQWLSFHLELDDRLIPTDHIFLGSMQSHPDHNPWVVRLGG